MSRRRSGGATSSCASSRGRPRGSSTSGTTTGTKGRSGATCSRSERSASQPRRRTSSSVPSGDEEAFAVPVVAFDARPRGGGRGPRPEVPVRVVPEGGRRSIGAADQGELVHARRAVAVRVDGPGELDKEIDVPV